MGVRSISEGAMQPSVSPPPQPLAPFSFTQLADDYTWAYKHLFGALPSKQQVLLAAAVGQCETNSGRAWPGTFNIGAVQLRTLTKAEQAAFKGGTLQKGDTLSSAKPGAPGGVLEVDSSPNTGAYAVWEAAFPTQLDGAVYFIRALFGPAVTRAASDLPSLAAAMYFAGYYEGTTPGARPPSQRSIPFTSAEQANVDAYAAWLVGCYNVVAAALAAWQPQDLPPSAAIGGSFKGDWPGASSGISAWWFAGALAVGGATWALWNKQRRARIAKALHLSR